VIADAPGALDWHLRYNVYPPPPETFHQACEAAIAAVSAGDPGKPIDLPAGITWRLQDAAPAAEIVETFHLEDFCDPEPLADRRHGVRVDRAG
jgi:hypothetical protein